MKTQNTEVRIAWLKLEELAATRAGSFVRFNRARQERAALETSAQ